MYGENSYSDADTFQTSDFTVVVNATGHCSKHPDVLIRGRDKDGYKFERDSCPKCDKEFDEKLGTDTSKRERERILLKNLFCWCCCCCFFFY